MNTGDAGFTVKEIVIDIRDTLKSLDAKVDRIDREGAIGTRDQLAEYGRVSRDNTQRLERVEKWQSDRDAVAVLKRWQLTVALGLLPLVIAFLTSWLTYYWINHG